MGDVDSLDLSASISGMSSVLVLTLTAVKPDGEDWIGAEPPFCVEWPLTDSE